MENSSNHFANNFVTYCPQNISGFSDCTLKTEDGGSFPVHKFLLAKRSQFFYSLFCSFWNEKDILIPHVKAEDLSNILFFLYTGNIHVTENNITSLITSSDFLQVDDLLFKLKLLVRRNLTSTNGISIFKTSLALNLDYFTRESFRFVQTNFETLVRCEDSKIPELSLETLSVLLGDKSLRVTSENVVWLAIIKWVEADTHNRLVFVPELLKHLSISDIDENIANEVLKHDIVARNPCCREIHHGKSIISGADDLLTLQCYLTHSRPLAVLCEQRHPSTLNLIAFCNRNILITDIPIYVTYDENIDLWRKLTVIRGRTDSILLTVNSCLYMFQQGDITFTRYNIIEKQCNEFVVFRAPRFYYQVVELHGSIYILGGYYMGETNNETNEVEVYDCETGRLHFTTPMLFASSFSAVACNNVIYTVGYRELEDDNDSEEDMEEDLEEDSEEDSEEEDSEEEDLDDFEEDVEEDFEEENLADLEEDLEAEMETREMVAQAFDPISKTWRVIPSPSSIRSNFSMLVYRGMIYVIGGFRDMETDDSLTDVEVFDPIKNEWSTEVNLPNAYRKAKAIVLNDKLIVYDDYPERPLGPPVQWNVHQKCWETLENPSMEKLNMHHLLTIENHECIKIISRESKDPTAVFEHTPFS